MGKNINYNQHQNNYFLTHLLGIYTMSLITLLASSQNGNFGDDQGPWRQFILDHLDFIANRSRTYEIDSPLMNLYRYDLKRFLRENLKIHGDLAWIVLLLNNLRNDFEWNVEGSYIIPDSNIIAQLYHSYITISTNSF